MEEEDGLVIMRGQPVHVGHLRLIISALKLCDRVYVVLGSTQEFGTSRNPFTFAERKKMLKMHFNRDLRVSPYDSADLDLTGWWSRIVVVGLKDIFSLRWPSYVLEEIAKIDPDANLRWIFGGSQYDVDWFKDHKLKPYIVDRTDAKYPYASASMIRDMLTYGDPRWMDYVSIANWSIVARKFNRVDMLPKCAEEDW